MGMYSHLDSLHGKRKTFQNILSVHVCVCMFNCDTNKSSSKKKKLISVHHHHYSLIIWHDENFHFFSSNKKKNRYDDDDNNKNRTEFKQTNKHWLDIYLYNGWKSLFWIIALSMLFILWFSMCVLIFFLYFFSTKILDNKGGSIFIFLFFCSLISATNILYRRELF